MRSRTRTCGRALRCGALALLLASASTIPFHSAFAQQALAERSFSVPPGSLSGALASFGQQAGLQMSYPATLGTGLTSPGLSGAMTVDEGLRRLLAGTGLTWRYSNANTVTLVALPREQGAMEVPTVDVQAGMSRGYLPVRGFVADTSSAGSKTDAPITEIPQSISVVTRDQMDQQNVQSVSQALRYVPGVAIESYGVDPKGFDWILLRGFNAQSTNDYRDGLRQANASYSFFRTEPYGLERIEILRGPASVLYGQADAGGIVNRVSKRPSATRINEVNLQAGNHNFLRGSFDLTGPVDQDAHLLYRFTGLFRRSDTEFSYNGRDTSDDRVYLAPSFTWAPDAATNVTVFADYLRDESGGTLNFITRNGNPSRTLVGDPNFDLFSQKQFNVGYLAEHRINQALTVRQNLRYGEVDILFNNLQLLARQPDGVTYTRYARRFDERLTQFSVDTNLEARFATGPFSHTLLGGMDYYRIAADVRRTIGTAPSLNTAAPVYGLSTPYPTVLQQNYGTWSDQFGFYLQDQARIDRWVLTAGGRVDVLSTDTHNYLARTRTSQDDTAFTGRLGVTYLGPYGISPYVSYAESFVPNIGLSSPRNGSQPFDPSYGRQWEAGVKVQPTGLNALFTAAVFDINKTNVLTTDLVTSGYSIAEGEIRSRGVELESRVTLAQGLDLLASYTFTDAEVTRSNSGNRGKEPTLVPRNMASAWVNYRVPEGPFSSLSVGAGVRYVGGTWGDTANTIRISSHTLYDAAIGYDIGPTRLTVNATNLGNQRVISTCGSLDTCYLAAGRTVIAGLRYRF